MSRHLTREQVHARVLAHLRTVPEIQQTLQAQPDYLRILNVCPFCGMVETKYCVSQPEGTTLLGGMEPCGWCVKIQQQYPEVAQWVLNVTKWTALMENLLSDTTAPTDPLQETDGC